MGFSLENKRMGYIANYCDECGTFTEELFKSLKYTDICWECYKEQFLSKVCDDMDDTLCAECGSDAEDMFLYNGDWVCEDCLKDMAERVDTE